MNVLHLQVEHVARDEPLSDVRVVALVDGIPEPNTLADYEPAYLQYLAEAPTDSHNLSRLADWLELYHPLSGASVCDVGAGGGKFVRYLHSRNATAVGIEPSHALYDRFLTPDPRFIRTDAETFAGEQPGRFDVVTAFDVIEHVPDPRAFLDALVRLTRLDGIIVISTPDAASLLARLLGRAWHFYHQYHLSYFTPETMRRLVSEFQLEMRDRRHLGRVRSLGYVAKYINAFQFGSRRLRATPLLDRIAVPINAFDTLYLILSKLEPVPQISTSST